MDSTFTYNTANTSTGLLTCYLPDLTKINAAPTTLISTKLNLKINTTSSFSANIFILPTETITTPCNQCFYQGTHSISSGENTIELDLTAQINNPTQYDKNIYIRISPTTSASFTAQGQLTVKVSSDRMSNFIDQTVPSQAHSTYDLGKIGSVNVNLRDGSLTFSHTDLALNGGKTAFSLVHTYNSLMYNSDEYVSDIHTQTGHGWKTNYHQFLAGDNAYASYFDATGKEHRFATSNGKIYDTSGLGLYFEKENCKRLYDNNGNLMRFSPYGYLCCIKSNIGNELYVNYEETGTTTTNVNDTSSIVDSLINKRIAYVKNGSDMAKFTYTNNLLTRVSYLQNGSSSIAYHLEFAYSGNNLTKISKKLSDGTESIQAQFAYDTKGRLNKVYGNDYTHLKISYDTNGKVSKLSKCSDSTNAELSSIQIEYASNAAYVTNELGARYKYTIKSNGDVYKIEEVNDNNSVLCEVYPDKNPNSRSITTMLVGDIDLDTITQFVHPGHSTITFGQTQTTNSLTVDDIRATLQSLAQSNGTFDFFYNNKKDRVCGLTTNACSLSNGSKSASFSATMLSTKTTIKDVNGTAAIEIVAKETFDQNGIKTITSQKLSSSSTSININESYTKYNGQTTYNIESDYDNTYKIRTDYTYDSFGNLLKTTKKDIYTNPLSGECYTSTAYSTNGEHATSETNERGKTTYFDYSMPYNALSSITSPKNVTKSFNYDPFKEYLSSVSCTTGGQTYTNNINSVKNRINSISNATGTYNFTYDTNTGDLTQVTSSSGTVLYKNSFNYSTHTNTKTYHDNSTETTTYDKYGNVSSVTHGGKTATFAYQDKNGTLNSKAKVKTITDGFAGTTNTYDKTETDGTKTIVEVKDTLTSDKGSWIKKNYISGSKAILEYLVGGSNRVDTTNDRMLYYTESYDGFGKPISRLNISHNNTFTHTVFVDYEKDRFNRTTERHIAAPGSYVTKNYTYADSSTRRVGLISKETSTYSNGNTESRSYTYDDNGNITKIAISGTDGSKTTTYTYDGLNRLTKEVNGETGNTITYNYDNGGNITSKTKNGSTISYSYNSSWKDLLTSYNGQSIVYNNGYPTTYKGKSLTWSRGKLVTYNNGYGTNFNYTYDVNGRKTKVERGISEICYFFYDGDKLVAEHWYTPSGTTPFVKVHYLYDDQGIVGFKAYKDGENNNNYEYFTVSTDILGNVVRIDNANGWVAKISYDAFGTPTYKNNTNNTPALGYSPQTFFKLAYKGYYYDPDLKLYYLMSRYYDPETGRFISPDSIDYLEPETITGVNLYSYCYNNPVMYSDPSGHSAILFAIGIGALLGGIYGGFSAAVNGQNILAGIAINAVVGGLTGLLGAVFSTPLMLVGSFVVGFSGDVASQIILDNKSIQEVNLTTAFAAGIINAGAAFIGKGISNISISAELNGINKFIFESFTNGALFALATGSNLAIANNASSYTIHDMFSYKI